MNSPLNQRSCKVLETVIEEYINTATPVASRTVCNKISENISSATIRNTMAKLDEMGYLHSPHTSAGRIPTQKAYRFYVDSLLKVERLSHCQQQQIHRQVQNSSEQIELLLQRVSKTLSRFSRYTGLVAVPETTVTLFRHIEMTALAPRRLLITLVTRTGFIRNHIVHLRVPLPAHAREQLGQCLNSELADKSLQEIRKIYHRLQNPQDDNERLLKSALTFCRPLFMDTETDEKLFVEGTSNILEQPDFENFQQMKLLFQAFEQKDPLLHLMNQQNLKPGVRILIGGDSGHHILDGCSLIASSYSNRHGVAGTLGVIGPSRMPYHTIIPIVDYTAHIVSRVLETD